MKFVRSTFPGRQAALWQNWSHIVVLRTIITADAELGRVTLDVLSGVGRPRPSADTPATPTPHSEVTALKNKRSEDVKRRREGRTGRMTMFAGVGVIVERLSSCPGSHSQVQRKLPALLRRRGKPSERRVRKPAVAPPCL